MAEPELPVTASLVMDRAIPIGNSPNPNTLRRRLHVLIDNILTEPIPVFVTDQQAGTPHFVDAAGITTTPGIQQILFSDAVPLVVVRTVRKLIVSCNFLSNFSLVTTSGKTLAAGRTGPFNQTVVIPFDPFRPVNGSDTIQLLFTALAGQHTSTVDA